MTTSLVDEICAMTRAWDRWITDGAPSDGKPNSAEAMALLRAAFLELERLDADPRHAEPIGLGEVTGLTVAFKALVQRAGGRVEITEAELLEARALHARVDATPEVMVVELVQGPPPDVPRFEVRG